MVNFNESVHPELGKLLRIKNGSNRIVFYYENGELLISYTTLVAVRCKGKLYFTSAHDCSQTTRKQVTQWCGISVAARREGLKNGVYTLIE